MNNNLIDVLDKRGPHMWQFDVTKLGANETYYISMPQSSTDLTKKQINEILNTYRKSGYKIRLKGYGYRHYCTYMDKSCNMCYYDLDTVLYEITQLKFHRDVKEQTIVHKDRLIDSFYLTKDEMFQLDVLTRYSYVDYNGLDYTFLNSQFPTRFGQALFMDVTRYGNFFYRGTIYHSIDHEKGIVKFFRRTTSYETTTKTIEL